ncbi:MAG: hypothetical protein WKF75_05940 [Singulisphaera sp.]
MTLQVKLRPETKLWLEVQSVGRRMTVSEVIEELVKAAPAGWTISRPRSDRQGTTDPADVAVEPTIRLAEAG